MSVLDALSVPSGWDVHPLGGVFERRKVTGYEDLEPLSVFTGLGVVPRTSQDWSYKALGESLGGYLLVEPRDLVFNKLRAWQGAIGVSNCTGIVSPAYFVCRSRGDVDARYFHYLLRSTAWVHEIKRLAKWMPPNQNDISWDLLKKLRVWVPPVVIQRAIADYLDRETTRLDSLITKKREMSALVDERWRALLQMQLCPPWAADLILMGQRVATARGLQIRKLGSLTRRDAPIAYGILLAGDRLDVGVPYIGAGDVRPDRLRLEVLPRTAPEIAAAYPRTKMRAGELVYAIRGSFGAVEVLPAELEGVNLSRDAARIAPGPDVDGTWLAYFLKSELAQEQFRRREVGAMVTGVNIEDLKSVRIPLPQLREQLGQVQILDEMRKTFDGMRATAATQLELLDEHRRAVISAAVTGQLEIPGAAA